MDLRDVVTTVSGRPISVEDVLVHLKAHGTFRNGVYQVIEREVVRVKCQEHGVELDVGELDRYAEARRREIGLDDAVAMNNYCLWLGISFDQWNTTIEIDLLKMKLAEKVITGEAVLQHYEQYKDQLKTIALSRIVCNSKDDINKVQQYINEEGREFATVAREHSQEEGTRMSGGYIGTVKKGMLSDTVETSIFTANEHDLLGPFQENGYWTFYQVEKVTHAQLDNELRYRISQQLFTNWLGVQLHQARA